MDLTQTLRYKVLVERVGFAFFVELEYENLPSFCMNCKIIGHNVEECKRLYTCDEIGTDKDIREKRNYPKETKKVYVQKKDDREEQINPKIVDVENDKNKEEAAKVYVQTKDGRNGKDTENEIINVESDKNDNSLPADNTCDNGEVNSKNCEQVSYLGASSSTKKRNSNSNQGVSQLNLFSPLVDQGVEGSQNSTQHQLHHLASDNPINQATKLGRAKSIVPVLTPVLSPGVVFKEQDLRLEADLNED
jgi:hypothetical protein